MLREVAGIAVHQDLTDEWQYRGATNSLEYAILTNEIMQGAFDLKVDEYKAGGGRILNNRVELRL